jgi:hypothetical protein
MTTSTFLTAHNPNKVGFGFREWLSGYATMADAWRKCANGPWMVSMLLELRHKPEVETALDTFAEWCDDKLRSKGIGREAYVLADRRKHRAYQGAYALKAIVTKAWERKEDTTGLWERLEREMAEELRRIIPMPFEEKGLELCA